MTTWSSVSSSQFQSPPVGAVMPPWVVGTVAALEEEEEEEEDEDDEGAEAAAAAPLDEDEDEEGAFLPAGTNADDVAEAIARGAYSTGAGAAAGAKFDEVDEVEALEAPGPPIDTAPISFARRSTAACSLACSLSEAPLPLLPLLAVFLLIGAALVPAAAVALVGLGPRVAAELEVVVVPEAAALLSWKMSNLWV